MMKKIWQRFLVSFFFTTLGLLLVNVVVFRRLGETFPHFIMVIGSLLIAASITLSITLFRIQKLNSLLATLFGLIPLLAIPLILRRIYGVILFRFSFVIIIAFAVCAVIYAIAVLIVANRYKKEEKDLNELLK